MAAERPTRRKRPRPRGGGKIGSRRLARALTIEERRHKAFQLKVDGLSLHEIGKRLGCSVGTVSDDIWTIREELADTTLKLAAREREITLARCEEAIAGVMPRARKGDPDAILSLDRMEKTRRAILGLDAPTRQEVQLSGSVTLDEVDDLAAAARANGCSPPATSPEPESSDPAPLSDESEPSS